jgi:zinc transport system ATP-binding protein
VSTPPVPVVEISRLCVEFDGEHVLEDVDLTIDAGSVVALLGPNGSGKTTLVRTLLGLQPFSHGKVALFGTALARFRDWDKVALVPQRLPGASAVPVSVWETVLSGLISPRRRWRPLTRAERAAAADALKQVDLWERRHDRLDTLSGGQQRRVLIARALASSPRLLVMDEPTAGVDAENVARLAALLAQLHADGVTSIIVTHELTGIADVVTRAVVLEPQRRGSVAYDGPPPVPDHIDDHAHHDDAPVDVTPVVPTVLSGEL